MVSLANPAGYVITPASKAVRVYVDLSLPTQLQIGGRDGGDPYVESGSVGFRLAQRQ